MQYVISVFSSRRDAIAMYDYLLRRRLPTAIINTPRELSVSCGISVQSPVAHRQMVMAAARAFDTYLGSYLITRQGLRQTIDRL